MDDDIELGWKLHNEVNLLIEELEYVRDKKEELADSLNATAQRQESINAIQNFFRGHVKSRLSSGQHNIRKE